jgi:hypothetical protein
MSQVYHREVVKLLFLCARRAGLSHAEYRAHLLERHVPLALRHHSVMRGYRLHLVEESLDGAPAIDSVNVLDYDSLEDFNQRGYDSPEGERIVTADHARFLGQVSGYAAEERDAGAHTPPSSPLGARTAGTSFVCALRRNPRLDAERFARALATDLVPELLASRANTARVALANPVQKLFPPDAEDWDAFLELGFSTAAPAPLHPFHSLDCGVSLLRRVTALCAELAVWRTAEYVQRVAVP